ncbi:hypothetical protein A4D02_29025 [Niastella koreensis]|uniref:Glycoside hydrolase family 5 domain-containing protein n=2 Tax=Niastella koreensis TaxID=354356 RepID=A0ABX3NY99_9BACT|nr:hypothetical protein A4D02_29025 [Niastella koreensis]
MMLFRVFLLTVAGFSQMPFLKAQRTALKPTSLQLNWQAYETTAFLHFSINTFTDKEWGDGKEDPQLFNPVQFDARQWVKALKHAGFKMAIILVNDHYRWDVAR